MENQSLDTNTKLDILKFVHQDQRNEMKYRREREYRIFTWSSSILLALIGALLITKQSENLVWWKSYGGWGNIVASAAVVLIVAYSTMWQFTNSRFRGYNAQVVSHIDILLHCHEEGYFDPEGAALFPDHWRNYGRDATLHGRLFGVNYVSAVLLLGVLALIMIWTPQ